MKYDFLVVGAGFFGATFARRATDLGKSCLVIDKRDSVGGMAADKLVEGIVTSMHGAHIFHTHVDEIWNFVNQFGEWSHFINKPKVKSGDKVYSFPINLMTLHQIWGVTTPQEALTKLNEVRVPCNTPRNFEEWALSMIGAELYELFIYGYTKKQYMREPRELPASIIKRLPIRLSYEENYFTTKYQGMPIDGYSGIVKNMLDGIQVELGVNFFDWRPWREVANHLVYTGPVDKFFDYAHGHLDYNTMEFRHEIMRGDFQGNAVFNHVDLDVPHLRTIEHKHFVHTYRKHYDPGMVLDDATVVSYDLPAKYIQGISEPYYPIRDTKNSAIYNKYVEMLKDTPDVTFGGRLGEYKYYDIDQTIASAMQKASKLCTT